MTGTPLEVARGIALTGTLLEAVTAIVQVNDKGFTFPTASNPAKQSQQLNCDFCLKRKSLLHSLSESPGLLVTVGITDFIPGK